MSRGELNFKTNLITHLKTSSTKNNDIKQIFVYTPCPNFRVILAPSGQESITVLSIIDFACAIEIRQDSYGTH